MVQRYTSKDIPYSREGPNEEKGGSGIRVPVVFTVTVLLLCIH
jgi:hypothetical protein